MIKAVIFDMFETLVTHYRTPIYFSDEMAKDAGIYACDFQKIWRATDSDRTLGKRTFESVLEEILRANGKYTDELYKTIAERRIKAKEACFKEIDPEIEDMLDFLKAIGIKIGLITNCFTEEAPVIEKSPLFRYFDSVCMSCRTGIKKPDEDIYVKCLLELKTAPDETIYVGDGGSSELYGAEKAGLTPYQACWFLLENGMYEEKRDEHFRELKTPMELADIVR